MEAPATDESTAVPPPIAAYPPSPPVAAYLPPPPPAVYPPSAAYPPGEMKRSPAHYTAHFVLAIHFNCRPATLGAPALAPAHLQPIAGMPVHPPPVPPQPGQVLRMAQAGCCSLSRRCLAATMAGTMRV